MKGESNGAKTKRKQEEVRKKKSKMRKILFTKQSIRIKVYILVGTFASCC